MTVTESLNNLQSLAVAKIIPTQSAPVNEHYIKVFVRDKKGVQV